MADQNSNIKRVFAMCFVLIMAIGFVRSDSYAMIRRLSDYLGQEDLTDSLLTLDTVDDELVSSMYMKRELIDLNGYMAKKLGMQGFYGYMGMYVTDDDYIVSASDYTTTDYEYYETIAFKDFLDANGINFLYVNKPTKYLDDSLFYDEFGVETYSNRNMDLFLSRIREAGINTVDLRDNIRAENRDIRDMFFRTDHHWTVPSGLWAAGIMARSLNEYCGYDIDLSLYDESNYSATEWKECWLGEQGRKVAESYVGLDDYTELKPVFPTDFTFKNDDGTFREGTFDDFILEDVHNTENDVYENYSWYLSYLRLNNINNNVADGKVLIVGDSYDHVTVPFLSLGIHETDVLILRDQNELFSLRNYILDNDYDTVIVAYAQFMLGAHDDVTSSNYNMYAFDH